MKTKNEILHIRIEPELKKSCIDTAKVLNMHYSQFVRDAIKDKIERVK